MPCGASVASPIAASSCGRLLARVRSSLSALFSSRRRYRCHKSLFRLSSVCMGGVPRSPWAFGFLVHAFRGYLDTYLWEWFMCAWWSLLVLGKSPIYLFVHWLSWSSCRPPSGLYFPFNTRAREFCFQPVHGVYLGPLLWSMARKEEPGFGRLSVHTVVCNYLGRVLHDNAGHFLGAASSRLIRY